jgi:hypothetical protein
MWKQLAIGAGVTAAVVGVGTAALATTGDTTSGSPTTTSTTASTAPTAPSAAKHPGHPALRRALGRRSVVHGQIVTQNPKTKQFVTHDVIKGSVSSVSPTSITVKAADNTSETFAVTSDTKVRTRTAGKPGSGKAATIGDVKQGDTVAVVGTGSTTLTATQIVDGLK